MLKISLQNITKKRPSFGTPLYNRGFSFENYRYGYQGSEKDNEIKGKGNSYTTEFRILDTRLVRWLSLDPKESTKPEQSPYASMDNNPIMFNDLLGDLVGYEKFRDKVNVAVARLFSKSFNTQYKAFRSDECVTFTYKKRDNNPTLYEGPALKNVDASKVDVLYSTVGPSPQPPPPPPPATAQPLDDKVQTPKELAAPGSEFEANYTITDYTNSSLDINTASYADKIELVSKGNTTVVKNPTTDKKGYTKFKSHIDLKAMNDAGTIDSHVTVKITGNEKQRTFWKYHIKADQGTKDSYSTPVKHGKAKVE